MQQEFPQLCDALLLIYHIQRSLLYTAGFVVLYIFGVTVAYQSPKLLAEVRILQGVQK